MASYELGKRDSCPAQQKIGGSSTTLVKMGYVFEDDNNSNLILSRIFAHWAKDCSQLLSWYSTIPISKEYIIYDIKSHQICYIKSLKI